MVNTDAPKPDGISVGVEEEWKRITVLARNVFIDENILYFLFVHHAKWLQGISRTTRTNMQR